MHIIVPLKKRMQRYEKIVNFYVSLLNYMRIKQAEKSQYFECRDARLVRPLQKDVIFVDMDARAVCPYTFDGF